jgi:hypothetical protein
MFMTNRCSRLASRATPLASCVAAFLGLNVNHHALAATTHFVSSCANTGAGTLRAIVGDTVGTLSGDTIDFVNVAPCTVSLTTGAIDITQNDLTIQAPSGSSVSINGKYNGSTENARLIHHTGTGLLGFSNINFYNGNRTQAGDLNGGCVYSAGSVQILYGNMVLCYARSTGGTASGGAVFAAKQVTMKYSNVFGSEAKSDGGRANGGGIFGGTGVGMKYSTVTGNQVTGGVSAFGGGVYSAAALRIKSSTISGNLTSFSAGGVFQSPTGTYAHIYSSTISGNTSSSYTGGMMLQAPDQVITNSTIAFNYSPTTQGFFGAYAPGLTVITQSATTLKLQSTIVSNNSSAPTSDFDMSLLPFSGTFAFDAASSNNLVRVPGNNFAVPGLTGTCPFLMPLRDNGGFTQTHALSSNSVAIDNGSNPKGYTTDERGNATLYPRPSGAGTDMGAYEVNQDDIIFVTGDDGCN